MKIGDPRLERAKLNEKGQCPHCRIKPLAYKRDGGPQHPRGKFCPRCCRSFNIETGEQQANWAWTARAGGLFAPKYRHVQVLSADDRQNDDRTDASPPSTPS